MDPNQTSFSEKKSWSGLRAKGSSWVQPLAFSVHNKHEYSQWTSKNYGNDKEYHILPFVASCLVNARVSCLRSRSDVPRVPQEAALPPMLLALLDPWGFYKLSLDLSINHTDAPSLFSNFLKLWICAHIYTCKTSMGFKNLVTQKSLEHLVTQMPPTIPEFMANVWVVWKLPGDKK